MNILVACEFSGIVRDAFIQKGHNAWSCDLLPTERKGPHIIDSVMNHLDKNWKLMIAHPPCTYLAVSGARWWKDNLQNQLNAIRFVECLLYSNIPQICIENPIGKLSTSIRTPDQIIQPWMFGHGETKSTCLWLKNLPQLKPTQIVEGREARIHNLPPSNDRWKIRSRTYLGIAKAMAEQWG